MDDITKNGIQVVSVKNVAQLKRLLLACPFSVLITIVLLIMN